jgi:hypothetical protein
MCLYTEWLNRYVSFAKLLNLQLGEASASETMNDNMAKRFANFFRIKFIFGQIDFAPRQTHGKITASSANPC